METKVTTRNMQLNHSLIQVMTPNQKQY